jgi:hypothetical protein
MVIKSEGWLKRIHKAEATLKKELYKIAEKSEKHYFNDIVDMEVEVAVYKSNIDVIKNALYSRNPVAEVRKRKVSENPLDKDVVEVAERSINYQIDNSDFYSDIKRAILDYLLADFGVVRVRYDFKTAKKIDELGQEVESIVDQSIEPDHWPYKRFVYDIGKDWNECDWVCYKHYMSGKEVKTQFNVDINKTQLETDQSKIEKKNKTTVYEVWDKVKRKVYFLMEGRSKPLDVKDDPLLLEQFFDCTKPMISNMRSDKYIPRPDFVMIEKQINTINMLEYRINELAKNVRDVGFYESNVEQLGQLETAQDGKLVAVSGLMELMDGKTDFSSVIAKLPIDQQIVAIQVLQDRQERAKKQLDEISGISDIVRGSTKASETATAQQIKGQWANVRLQDKQNTVNGMLRQLLRMYSEIIGEHFNPQVLSLMTGVEVTPEIKQVLSQDLSRSFAIDVETDSTIAIDEQQDKQNRTEMLSSVTSYLQAILPAVQQQLMPADIAKEILLINVRGYKHARNLEDMILSMDGSEQQLQQLSQQLQQVQQESQQMQEQANMQLQQAGQQIQILEQQLAQVNQQEEQRKDLEVKGEAMKDQAQAEKEHAQANKLNAEAQKIGIESAIGQEQLTVGLNSYN